MWEDQHQHQHQPPASLEPSVRYESCCHICHQQVSNSALLCSDCLLTGGVTDLANSRRREQSLLNERDRLADELAAYNDAGLRRADAACNLCERRLKIVSLRLSLRELKGSTAAAASRRLSARSKAQQLEQRCSIYREKKQQLIDYLTNKRAELTKERVEVEKLIENSCTLKRRICRGVARDVYNVKCCGTAGRSLINDNLKLPPLNTLISGSLDPSVDIYDALLSIGSLMQCIGACLLIWTPFQPRASNFLKSPLSRDSISAQRSKLESALHSLCCQFNRKFFAGDPLLTLFYAIESIGLPNGGENFQSDSYVLYDSHHVMAEWETPQDSIDVAGIGGDDWVEVQADFPIPADSSCYESRAFLSSLWQSRAN